MQSNALWIFVILILLAIIGVLAWLQFGDFSHIAGPSLSMNAPNAASSSTTTIASEQSSSTLPLSSSVRIDAPAVGAVVGKTFTVSGAAPGGWYFEAVFPIQVRDNNDNIIARAQGQAQGEWTTSGLVAFAATTTLDTAYSGPATLILLKDNPSGLPENDDSVSIPIVVQ